MAENKIVITVDSTTRALKYEGSLILGVRGDNAAQRIYFKCPKSINNIFDDVTADDITVYVDYKNALKESYKQECSDVVTLTSDENYVTFSWLVSYYAAVKAGIVELSVCIKKNDSVTGTLTNEWHSGTIKGTILEGNCNVDALEIITPETVSYEALALEVAGYKIAVEGFEEAVANQAIYIGEFEGDYFDPANDYLASFTTPGIYTFRKKTNNATVPYLFAVEYFEMLGSYMQSVFYNMTSGGFGYEVRATKGGGSMEWGTSTKHDFVTHAECERKYYELVSTSNANQAKTLEKDFVLAMHVSRDNGTITNIYDKNSVVIQAIQYTVTDEFDISIRGTYLGGNKYLLECECNSDGQDNCKFVEPKVRIVTINGPAIYMAHSDYITKTGDTCYLVTNL